MKQRNTLKVTAATALLILLAPAHAQVVEVGTEFGNGADARPSNDGGILGTSFADDVFGDFFATGTRFRPLGSFNERLSAGLVRWDLSGVTEDFNDLAGAGFKMHSVSQRRNLDVYGLIDGDAGESWDEATLTWNNTPGLTPNPAPYADVTTLAGQVDTGRWVLLGEWEPSGVNSDQYSDTLFTTSFTHADNPTSWVPAFPAPPDGAPPTNEDPAGEVVFADDYGSVDPALNANLTSFIQADTDQQVTLMFFPRDWQVVGGTDGLVSFLTKEHDHIGNPEELLFPIVTTPTLVMEFGAALEGDLNGDGFVGIDDLNIVLGNWNQNVPPADPAADPSGDGFVGIDDLNAVLGNWNAGTPPAANAIPEPGTLVLLGAGGHMTLLRRRYRKDQ